MVGCDVFVHHFETVAGSFPNCSASHLLVRFLSANTTFIRLISLSIMIAIGSPKFYICRKDTKYNPQIVREIEKSDEK